MKGKGRKCRTTAHCSAAHITSTCGSEKQPVGSVCAPSQLCRQWLLLKKMSEAVRAALYLGAVIDLWGLTRDADWRAGGVFTSLLFSRGTVTRWNSNETFLFSLFLKVMSNPQSRCRDQSFCVCVKYIQAWYKLTRRTCMRRKGIHLQLLDTELRVPRVPAGSDFKPRYLRQPDESGPSAVLRWICSEVMHVFTCWIHLLFEHATF